MMQCRRLGPSELSVAEICLGTSIGATSMAQLKQNIDSAEVSLDGAALAAIEDVHLRYPHPAW